MSLNAENVKLRKQINILEGQIVVLEEAIRFGKARIEDLEDEVATLRAMESRWRKVEELEAVEKAARGIGVVPSLVAARHVRDALARLDGEEK